MPNLDLYGLESAQYNFEDPRFDIAMFDDKNHKVEPLSTEKSINTGQAGARQTKRQLLVTVSNVR